MKKSRLLVLVTLVLLLPVSAVTSLAYASPPDPSWIRGLYDGGDHDDVVVLITSEAGTARSLVAADLYPPTVPVGHAPLHAERGVSFLALTAHLSRGPPVN